MTTEDCQNDFLSVTYGTKSTKFRHKPKHPSPIVLRHDEWKSCLNYCWCFSSRTQIFGEKARLVQCTLRYAFEPFMNFLFNTKNQFNVKRKQPLNANEKDSRATNFQVIFVKYYVEMSASFTYYIYQELYSARVTFNLYKILNSLTYL